MATESTTMDKAKKKKRKTAALHFCGYRASEVDRPSSTSEYKLIW